MLAMDVEAPIILSVTVPAFPSALIAVDEAIYLMTVGDPLRGNGNNNRVDIINSRVIRGSTSNKAIKGLMGRAPTPTMPPTRNNMPANPSITLITIRTDSHEIPRTIKEEDQTDLVVTTPTRRRRNDLRTHLPTTPITEEIMMAGTTVPHRIGGIMEITNNPTGVIMASTISNAKGARNRVNTSSLPIIMGTPSTKCSQRKRSNKQIDMKGPRESRQHALRTSKTY